MASTCEELGTGPGERWFSYAQFNDEVKDWAKKKKMEERLGCRNRPAFPPPVSTTILTFTSRMGFQSILISNQQDDRNPTGNELYETNR